MSAQASAVDLGEVIRIHQAMLQYRDFAYINLIQQINTKTSSIIKDDLGSQFIHNCGRDLAGEVVRNFFNTSDYNITVDQLSRRILSFNYEDEYDPISELGSKETIQKSVFEHREITSTTLVEIACDLDKNQSMLFTENRKSDRLDMKGKKAYRESQRDENGDLFDELTGKKGTQTTVHQNGKDIQKSDLHADHRQSRESARYNSKYITQDGVQALKEFWNSSENMQLIHASANTSKGDVRVCEVNGKIKYVNTKEAEYDPKTDITHRATAVQLTEATIQQWEKGAADSAKIQKLLSEGYLQKDENGNITVPRSIKKALEHNIRESQNAESKVVLQNTKYDQVAKDAAKHTKDGIGKIIAGQIIYYAAPPLVFEIRTILQNRNISLDGALAQLTEAADRIGSYVLSKLKDIFTNVLFASLKKFIKAFMDILINSVKATIKKLLRIAKNLLLSTVDAVRIIADKNATSAEKADSVFNLFGVTITSCVIEILFELAAEALHIPEPFDDIIFGPLQILTTVICTNLTMLILQKADLFDVRFGFKINAVKNVFAQEYSAYEQEMMLVEEYASEQIQSIIETAQQDTISIYNSMNELNPKENFAQQHLSKMSRMFNVHIDFDEKWENFVLKDMINALGLTVSVNRNYGFRTNYRGSTTESLAAIYTYQHFTKWDKKLAGDIPITVFEFNDEIESQIASICSIHPLIFGTIKEYLDRISLQALEALSVMISVLMERGNGVTKDKELAKARYDQYFKDRGVSNTPSIDSGVKTRTSWIPAH